MRPLDPLKSIKIKLGVLVASAVTVACLVVWVGLREHVGPRYTLPIALLAGLLLTQILARGMTSPLREMTDAAGRMARGDYSIRVRATSEDEVGQLARAFNTMAADLGQVEQMRRELVANVSHELRTPVAALQAQLENIVDGVTEPDSEELKTALAQTERLGQLVRQLLDLSRLEAGVVPFEPELLELTPFVHEAVDAARLVSRTQGHHVYWNVDIAPQDLTVMADPARLHQVIANLLDNASKHSPAGGVIAVRCYRRGEGATARVLFDIEDQGPGISDADKLRVFERFHRGGDSTGGTGLGLAITKWAVGLHRGTVEALDANPGTGPGRGTLMRVSLPLRLPRSGSSGQVTGRVA
ncbi:HAMP domain-containing protein [Micrococcales bacterium 31B]|nr:HAMP domain-containing protein [Micrococcales bacterium 31B]